MYYRRQSHRLFGFDYSTQGPYFITLRVQFGEKFFGEINDNKLYLSDAGSMINKWWLKIPKKYNSVSLDKFIIMPNHFHGIIIMCGHSKSESNNFNLISKGEHTGSPLRNPNPLLSTIIQWFKTMTTNDYINNVKTNGWKRFEGKL